jgi:glycosyltransferase involved in cell wall biosynthesis
MLTIEGQAMTHSNPEKQPVRIVFMTTSPASLRTFFTQQIRYMRRAGFVVHTVSTPGDLSGNADDRVPDHSLPMLRKISPMSDVLAIFRLCRLLRRIRPSLIHTHTPKAGLVGMIAATISRVKVRIYTVNGLVWATQTGWRRHLLQIAESLSCFLATEVLVVSDSLRRFIVENDVCAPAKARLLGHGASHGVDLSHFNQEISAQRGAELRTRLGIPSTALVLIFVGRFAREKGIEELAESWNTLRRQFPHAHLLLCGDADERDPVRPEILADLRTCPRVHFVMGSPDTMPFFYAASDICLLPTWREGLPNVALEAAAMQLPVVATKVTGCTDAVQDGITGILVAPRDPEAFASAAESLLIEPDMRRRMGNNARSFVAERFSEQVVCERLITEYRRLLDIEHFATTWDSGGQNAAFPSGQ